MLPPEVYKIIHLLGIAWLFFVLGGATLHALNGGDKASNNSRKLMAASHGVALVIILVAGFGMLGGKQMGTWVFLKFALWLVLGASLALIQKKPGLAKALWFVLPLLAAAGAYLAVYKPG
jgi:hypothetical protein